MMRMKRCPEQTDGVEGAYRYFAMAVAAEAGRYLRDNLNNRHQVRFKGVIDIVTEADQQAEDMIVGAIHRQYPHHDILAEESAAFTTGSPYRWIIDPLDGTTNYAHGYPVFCVSIALEWEGNCILGVVYNPMLEKQAGALISTIDPWSCRKRESFRRVSLPRVFLTISAGVRKTT